MGIVRLTELERRTSLRHPRATDRELLRLAASTPHIIISHDSMWSLDAPGAQEVYDVKFAVHPFKRPLTENDKLVAIEWAKYHPRYWRIDMTLDLHDGVSWYDRGALIETPEAYKLAELKAHIDANWAALEAKANHKHIRGRRWVATIIKSHERKQKGASHENAA